MHWNQCDSSPYAATQRSTSEAETDQQDVRDQRQHWPLPMEPDKKVQHADVDDECRPGTQHVVDFLKQACPGVSQHLLLMWAGLLCSSGLDSKAALETVRSIDDLPDDISLYARKDIAAWSVELRERKTLKHAQARTPVHNAAQALVNKQDQGWAKIGTYRGGPRTGTFSGSQE